MTKKNMQNFPVDWLGVSQLFACRVILQAFLFSVEFYQNIGWHGQNQTRPDILSFLIWVICLMLNNASTLAVHKHQTVYCTQDTVYHTLVAKQMTNRH